MNLFDGRFDLVDGYSVEDQLYKIQGSFTDNTGNFTSYDAQVGDIIYLDGSWVGTGLLRYKIVELHFDEYYDSVISATARWDMVEGIEPIEPFGGMEGIIGALHSNGLTANITTSGVNSANEVLVSKANSYQSMLLGMNAGGGGEIPDLSQLKADVKSLKEKVGSVTLEWEDILLQ